MSNHFLRASVALFFFDVDMKFFLSLIDCVTDQ